MATPTVTSVTPATDDYLGGAAVLIVGTNFTGASAVKFGTASTTDFTVVDATHIACTVPAHDAGAVAVEVTNADGTSEDGVEFTYTGTPTLFTVAEARAYDGARWLTSVSGYSDATILAQEAIIRERFESIIGVALTPTTTTEYFDGDGTNVIWLGSHNPYRERPPRAVTLTSIEVDGVAFTAAELAEVVCYPGELVREYGRFSRGRRNIKVVYTHGYASVPGDIKRAALQALIMPPPEGLIPTSVSAFASEGESGGVNWSRVKDPDRGRWFGNELVDGTLREHRARETMLGIA